MIVGKPCVEVLERRFQTSLTLKAKRKLVTWGRHSTDGAGKASASWAYSLHTEQWRMRRWPYDPCIIPAKACKHLHVFGLCWRRRLSYENILQVQLKSSPPASLSNAHCLRCNRTSWAFPRESQPCSDGVWEKFLPGWVYTVQVLKTHSNENLGGRGLCF